MHLLSALTREQGCDACTPMRWMDSVSADTQVSPCETPTVHTQYHEMTSDLQFCQTWTQQLLSQNNLNCDIAKSRQAEEYIKNTSILLNNLRFSPTYFTLPPAYKNRKH